MRRVKRELRIAEWAQLLQQRAESGKTINAWCEEQGIPRSMYFYWQRCVRKEAVKNAAQFHASTDALATISGGLALAPMVPGVPPTFAKITKPTVSPPCGAMPAMSIRIGIAECEIYNGADPGVIESALSALAKI
jgi:hypothetical protein